MVGSLDAEHTIKINGKEFIVDIVLEYNITGGQVAITHLAPENCQPGYEPDCEIELMTATIGFGNHVEIDLEESRWFSIIEEEINQDENIVKRCFEDSEDWE